LVAASTDDTAGPGVTPLYYRVIAGDPDSDHVVISLLAGTPQAATQQGLARVDVALRWDDGDWRIRVPLPRPTVFADASNYVRLGGTS
jgi:hypothetical protein